MAGRWRERITFAELIAEGSLEIGDGYRARNDELGGSGIMFLRAGHVRDTHIDFDGVERFHTHLEARIKHKLARVRDAVVTTKGNSTGRTTFISDSMPAFVYSPHLSYWRSRNADRVEGSFLRYWSKGPEFRSQLAGMKASTDMAPYLSLVDQKRLTVSLPPVCEQRAIAHVLGTLDDKIELNRRMSVTLEAIARALFKSWFVRRLPSGGSDEVSALGELPDGWRVGTFADVAHSPRRGIEPSAIPSGTPYIALEHMPKRSIALSDWGVADGIESGKLTFSAGEILFGKLRPYFHKVGVAPVSGVCSTDIAVIAPKTPEWFSYSLCVASSDEFVAFTDAGSTGTKMPRTKWSEMARYPIAVPPVALAERFDACVRPLVARIVSGIHESRTLGALRDTLLPKLISGELRVKDAERFVVV